MRALGYRFAGLFWASLLIPVLYFLFALFLTPVLHLPPLTWLQASGLVIVIEVARIYAAGRAGMTRHYQETQRAAKADSAPETKRVSNNAFEPDLFDLHLALRAKDLSPRITPRRSGRTLRTRRPDRPEC